MEFKEIENGIYVRSDSSNIKFDKKEYITIEGKEYERTERTIENISFFDDYKNQANKTNKLGWTKYKFDLLKEYFGIEFTCHIPEISHYWGTYSESERVDVLMTILVENIKIKGVEFENGKDRDYGNYQSWYELDVLENSYLRFYLDGYGWNNFITAKIRLRYLLDYNYQNILNKCQYKNFINPVFEKYYKDGQIPEPLDVYQKLIMLDIYKLKLNHKQRKLAS